AWLMDFDNGKPHGGESVAELGARARAAFDALTARNAGGLPVLAKHYWEGREFGDTTLETPVSSGPYRIKDFEPGRYISYERDPDWWAADLPVNLGRFNFDELRYDYYRDHLVAVEAFKAGEYDYRSEHISKVWATDYQIPEVDDGRIVKAEIPHQRPVGMQGFVFNMRKPLFQDPKVREALAYAFDFTWTNKNIFYDSYKQPYSYFNNSVMASTGLPEGEELALLEPWRDQIPERVFTEEYKAPLYTEPRDLRGGLRTALMLLQEAGWTVQDGVLKNEAGEPFEFEFLLIQPEFDRILLPMSKNLERLGIKMSIRPVDTSQYVNRLNEQDFDMIVFSWAQTESPGNEQREMWGSAAADQAGSRNLAGLKNPAVDALIEEIVTAPTREDLNLRVRAMDRILLWSFLVIPQSYVDSDRLIHWDRFGKPEVTPYKGVSIMTWWEDPDKAARLPGKQGDR
ncbi:MAG: ABC transporter substrate-binding protein, partial [Rhodospirillaceae bacterium]